MKVGMVVNNLSVSGGYQKLVIRLSQQLTKMGHDVIIYTPQLDMAQCYPEDTPSLHIITLDKTFGHEGPLETFTELSRQIDKQLDAIIIHDELSLLLVGLLKKPPRKILWMLNNQLPHNIKNYGHEIKSVYRQTVGPKSIRFSESKKAYVRVRLMRKGLRRVTNFLTYDDYNKQLVRRVLHRNATNVAAGADLEAFRKHAQARSTLRNKKCRVLSVGVIFPHRRYEDLIHAVGIARMRGYDVSATIIGRQDLSKDYFDTLVDLRTQLGLEKHVTFIHYVSNSEMIKAYKNADVFAFINDGFTWGISVFEAVAANLPVLITDNIGAADLILDAKNGLLVPPKKPKAIAKALMRIVDNPQLAGNLAKSAAEDILSYVSWEAYASRVLNILEEPANAQ